MKEQVTALGRKWGYLLAARPEPGASPARSHSSSYMLNSCLKPPELAYTHRFYLALRVAARTGVEPESGICAALGSSTGFPIATYRQFPAQVQKEVFENPDRYVLGGRSGLHQSAPRPQITVGALFILLRVRELCGAGRREESGGIGESLDCLLQCSDGRAAPFTSFGSFNRTQSCARTTQHAGPAIQARVPQNADRKGPRCSTQRASFASPHAERDVLSGVTRDGEVDAFISGPAACVGGVPLM